MFEVDKPRRFHYEPRFYDPEKERWEALKKKYADEQARSESPTEDLSDSSPSDGDDELAYFQKKVRDIEQSGQQQSSKLGWKDLFRKREMPKFNPQFHNIATTPTDSAADDTADQSLVEKYRTSKRQIKIKRRFDIGDVDYMKPVSGGKIILYTFIVFLLVVLILRF